MDVSEVAEGRPKFTTVAAVDPAACNMGIVDTRRIVRLAVLLIIVILIVIVLIIIMVISYNRRKDNNVNNSNK